MLKNLPFRAKNAVFRAEKRGLSKHYTGATVALRWTYVQLTDSLTPNRHRRWWNLPAAALRHRASALDVREHRILLIVNELHRYSMLGE